MIEQALLVGLGAWRITAMLSYERGPGDIFVRFRDWLGFEHHKDTKEPVGWTDETLNNLIACPWCLGVWAAAAFWGLWYIAPWLVGIFAAASILVAVEQWCHRSAS